MTLNKLRSYFMQYLSQILIFLSLLTFITGCATPGQLAAPAPAGPAQVEGTGPEWNVAAPVIDKPAANMSRKEETPVEAASTMALDLTIEPAPGVFEAAASLEQSNLTTDCPATHFLEVQAHPANAAYPLPQVEVTCNGDTFTVRSNGIPNLAFSQVTPNDLASQSYVWTIPLNPSPAAQPSDLPLLGPVAVAINGLPIFGPNEAQPTWGDPYLDQILDYCNGHTAQHGMYHFHARPDCLFTNLENNPGLIIGYAFDGYPILAPYLCLDAGCTHLKEVQSSWQHTQAVAAAWEAHEYIEGSGDLDRCNGMTLADGSYAYFATDTFPYFLGCYYGVIGVNNGFGGPQPGNGWGSGGPPAGPGFGPPPGNGMGPGRPPGPGRGPDLATAAARLGISEQALREALGPPPPNLATTAARLGITEQALIEALGLPPGGRAGRPPGNGN
jgi:hypothetical protein